MVEICSYILLLKNCLETEELLRDCLNTVHGVGCCSRGDGTGFVAQQLYEEKLVRSKWELNYVWNYLNGFYCNRVQLTSFIFTIHNTQYYRRIHRLDRIHRTSQIQGVPQNMSIARRLESRLWYMNLFVTFSLLYTLTCMVLKAIITIFSSPWHFQKVVYVFCTFNITGDIKCLVQISVLLNKSKILEIGTKFFISRVMFKAQKMQTTFCKWQD